MTTSSKEQPTAIRTYALPDADTSWCLVADGQALRWSTNVDRLHVIRAGVPYAAIESLSKAIHLPIKHLLDVLRLPQTTYNKKKAAAATLDPRDGELVMRIAEVIDYGQEVFNQEHEKFERWIVRPNRSLGGASPLSMFDTISGVTEVKACLDRLEHGNLA